MQRGRSAVTGRITTVSTARRNPSTHVVETVKPDKGDCDKPKKK